MDYIIQLFGNITFATVIIFVAAIVAAVAGGRKLWLFITSTHDAMQEKETSITTLQAKTKLMEEELNSLKNSNNTLTEAIAKIDSLAIAQCDLVKSISELSKVQKETSNKLIQFEKEVRVQNLNKLRDRLLQSYRYYSSREKNPLHAWTEMEKDAFDKLFKDYENLDGDGYMHTTVEPEMNSLEVIEMTDQDALSELMKSRKG